MKKISSTRSTFSAVFIILCFSVFIFLSCASNPPVFEEVEPPFQMQDGKNTTGGLDESAPSLLQENESQEPPLTEDTPRENLDGLAAEISEKTDPDIVIRDVELPVLEQVFTQAPADSTDTAFILAEPEPPRSQQLDVPEIPPPPVALLPPPPSSAEIPDPAALAAEAPEKNSFEEQHIEPEISGGIWVDTPSYPYQPVHSQVVPPVDATPSRAVALPSNSFLDIEYPGTGWIYLGEKGTEPLLVFSSRKLLGDNTLFTMRSKKSGTSLLHFYKQDLLTDLYIDDYLEVTVTPEQAGSGERISAPQYAAVVPANQPSAKTVAEKSPVQAPSPDSSIQKSLPADKTESSVPAVVTRQPTVVQTTESAPVSINENQNQTTAPVSSPLQNAATRQSAPAAQSVSPPALAAVQNVQKNTPQVSAVPETDNLSPDELIKQAEAALKANNAKNALIFLDAFFDRAVAPLDYGWLLRAQAYEAKTEVQNIRAAVDAYQTLMKQYPASRYWKQASERAAYLNRFYFTIR